MKTKNLLLIGVLLIAGLTLAHGQRNDQYNPNNKNDQYNQNNQNNQYSQDNRGNQYNPNQPVNPYFVKQQILNKLDTIDRFYLSRLKSRERLDARRKLDAVAQLVDQLSDELHRKEVALAEMDRKLKSREHGYDDRDRDKMGDRDRDQYDDRDRDQNRNTPRILPMSLTEFDQLITSLEKTPFDKDKKVIVRTSANNNYFMVDQVIKIASKFSFDNDKLDVIQTLYPKIIDLDKNYLLYNCFTFSDSKTKLEKFINANTQRR